MSSTEKIIKKATSSFKEVLAAFSAFAAIRAIIHSGLIEYIMKELAVSEALSWFIIWLAVTVFLFWRYEI